MLYINLVPTKRHERNKIRKEGEQEEARPTGSTNISVVIRDLFFILSLV
jgi:hypothetical protein